MILLGIHQFAIQKHLFNFYFFPGIFHAQILANPVPIRHIHGVIHQWQNILRLDCPHDFLICRSFSKHGIHLFRIIIKETEHGIIHTAKEIACVTDSLVQQTFFGSYRLPESIPHLSRHDLIPQHQEINR